MLNSKLEEGKGKLDSRKCNDRNEPCCKVPGKVPLKSRSR